MCPLVNAQHFCFVTMIQCAKYKGGSGIHKSLKAKFYGGLVLFQKD